MTSNNNVVNWYQESYSKNGLKAQRFYPNEELLRFLGRRYFDIEHNDRSSIKVLEIGCGSCANLWMISKEGFSSYGIDISENAITLGKKMMEHWGVSSSLQVASMTKLPHDSEEFDLVIDVFSSYCLNIELFEVCLDEIYRVLKPNGCFFSYTPGKNSDAFRNYYPSVKIDNATIDGIKRKNSPFFGNNYPFRFVDSEEYRNLLESHNFKVEYLETVLRTYNNESEVFEHVVIEGIKNKTD